VQKLLSEPGLWGAAFAAALALVVARAHSLQEAVDPDDAVTVQEAVAAKSDHDVPLTAVAMTDSDVLAIAGSDFLHASRSEKKWRPVHVPDEIPRFDRFVVPRPGATRVYFHPVRSDEVFVLDDPKTGATRFVAGAEARRETASSSCGIYVTDLAGRSWKLVNRDYDFEHVLETPGGLLYALASLHRAPARQDRVLRSADGARTWEDITHNAMSLGVGRAIGLRPDPDHPELVLIDFEGRRGYIVQAQDAEFHWQAMNEDSWLLRHPAAQDFFGPNFGYSGIESSADYMFPATRQNYFLHPFGNRLWIEPFELTLDRAEYEFSPAGPKAVRATIRFRRADHAAAIMDLKGAFDFWGLRIEGPDGQRTTVPPRAQARAHAGATPDEYIRVQKDYERLPLLLKTEIRDGRGYQRKVDFGRLHDFTKPGLYTVQLIYACPFWAGPGRTHWTGEFGGPAVKIRIR
jgi:hypothetical protein